MSKNFVQIMSICLISLMLLSVFACTSPAPAPRPSSSDSAARSRQAAEMATAEMEGRPVATVPTTTTPSTTQVAQPSTTPTQQAANAASRPTWVDNPENVFARTQFVSAVGSGPSRNVAEDNARANLARIFVQTIEADQTTSSTYREINRSGVTTFTEDYSSAGSVRTTTSSDALVATSIREVWHDTRSNSFYAVALMDRADAIRVYSDMILENNRQIANLLNLSPSERNTLIGYTRYYSAAAIADRNVLISLYLKVLGTEPPAPITSGNTYRLDAQSIIESIPIGIRVRNDKSNRIQSAFSKSFTELKFRSGGTNSRYICEVDITTAVTDHPNQPYKYVRIELNANLIDTSNGSILTTYSFNQREGHTTVSEAENRSYSAAERKIGEEYAKHIREYLDQLIN